MDTKCKGDPPPAGPNSLTRSNKIVDSAALLGPGNELLIRHQGRLYRLRRTRLGKLILTAVA